MNEKISLSYKLDILIIIIIVKCSFNPYINLEKMCINKLP